MRMRSAALIAIAALLGPTASLADGAGKPRLVGERGAWAGVQALVGLGGKLYAVEKDGSIATVDPATGKRARLGEVAFEGAPRLVAAGGALFAIDAEGDLTRVGPADGKTARVGKAGGYEGTAAAVGLGAKVYTIDLGGGLYATDAATGRREQRGEPDFDGVTFLAAVGEKLVVIRPTSRSAELATIDPATGAHADVEGSGAGWEETIAGVGLGGKLYTIETGGGLYETDIGTGKFVQIGKSEFAKTRLLAAAGEKLYALMGDDLFEVPVK